MNICTFGLDFAVSLALIEAGKSCFMNETLPASQQPVYHR